MGTAIVLLVMLMAIAAVVPRLVGFTSGLYGRGSREKAMAAAIAVSALVARRRSGDKTDGGGG